MRDVSIKALLLGSIFLIASGCGDNPTFSLLPDGQEFNLGGDGTFYNELDILFLIDNSSSMSENHRKLGSSFETFISSFVQKGWNYRIAVATTDAYRVQFQNINPGWTDEIYAKFKDGSGQNRSGIFVISPTTPDPASVFLTNVQVGVGGTGDERAFSSIVAALRSTTNTGFLRPNSFLAIIILSDEDDFSDWFNGTSQTMTTDGRRVSTNDHDYNDVRLDPVDSYVTYLDTLTNSSGVGRRYNVSAITKPDLVTCRDGTATIYGQRYIELANKTGGIVSNICEPNFEQAVTDIQTRISVLSTQVKLDRVPVESTIVITMNGQVVPKSETNGWWYIAEGNLIRFSGTAIPSSSVKVRIDYTPAAPKI